MTGFWIFICLLLICATIIICTFLSNAKENFSLWETKRGIRNICIRLDHIEEVVKPKGENE